jgi:hypothetical protein
LTTPFPNEISGYLHCGRCMEDLPPGISPKEYQRVQVGKTPRGLQVWCTRHDCNILHIDFEGHQHPADVGPD